MKITVLGSGSKGNSTLLQTTNTNILIDAGINYLTLKEVLQTEALDYILITHMHNDHMKYLGTIIKKTKASVYIPKEMFNDIRKIIPLEYIKIIENNFNILDVNIEYFKTSHDIFSVGYIIESNQETLVYITDTGYINNNILSKIKDKNIYIIESNHDEELVITGKYYFPLKQRILGDCGHLSNKMTANYLKQSIGVHTNKIVLAHLSEENNSEELVIKTMKELELDLNKIIIAKQHEITRVE